MEKEKKQQKEKGQTQSDTQDEIQLAALQLFAKKGYFNTSLTEITNLAGLKSTSAIYQHFKNKQVIASTLYESIQDSLSISIDDIRRRNKKPVEQLREIVDLMFRLTDEAPEIMVFLLVLNTDEFLPEEKPIVETQAFIKIHKIIEAGIKGGEIRSINPLIAYCCFFGVINQTLRMVLTGALEKQAESYQSESWVAAWTSIAKI